MSVRLGWPTVQLRPRLRGSLRCETLRAGSWNATGKLGWLVTLNDQPGNHVTPNFHRPSSDWEGFALCLILLVYLPSLPAKLQVSLGKADPTAHTKSLSVAPESIPPSLTSLKSILPDARDRSLSYNLSNTSLQHAQDLERICSILSGNSCLSWLGNSVQIIFASATRHADLMWASFKTSRTPDGILRYIVGTAEMIFLEVLWIIGKAFCLLGRRKGKGWWVGKYCGPPATGFLFPNKG